VTAAELERLTKARLVELAGTAGIRGRWRMGKAELVAALGDGASAHDRADPSPADGASAHDRADPSPADGAGSPAADGDESPRDDLDVPVRTVAVGGDDRPGHSARERRAALNERLAGFFDMERRCGRPSASSDSCPLPSLATGGSCVLHGEPGKGVDPFDIALPVTGRLGFDTWPSLVRIWRRGDYDIDAIGLDPVVADAVWHLLNYLYFDYFKVEVEGIEHLPATGPALLVANHGGAAIPYDGMLLGITVANEAAVPRRVRVTATELFNMVPVLAPLFRKSGGIYAAREDVEHVLSAGGLVGVFPEGEKGFMKPVWNAYEVQRFGRGGFVSIAERLGVPVVPVAIVGSEEVHPAITVSSRLGALVRAFLPDQRVEAVAVALNPIPLPVRWQIRFHRPVMPVRPGEAPDTLDMLARADMIRRLIQASLDEMLARRATPFRAD
jgi:1-acyl-sn-glycerol-3-phosphate acyltransferase